MLCSIFRRIINILNNKKKVAVISSTGMANLNVSNYGGTGLYDGRYGKEDLAMKQRQGYISDKAQRIRKTYILVINEIRMLARETFETLEYICRMIWKPFAVFGGIQASRRFIFSDGKHPTYCC